MPRRVFFKTGASARRWSKVVGAMLEDEVPGEERHRATRHGSADPAARSRGGHKAAAADEDTDEEAVAAGGGEAAAMAARRCSRDQLSLFRTLRAPTQ